MTHELKTSPDFYQAVIEGRKTFEVRNNDRGFREGDTLLLQEWKPDMYTGREAAVRVTYILSGGQYGVSKDYVVMAIKPIGARR